jgi:hypothetical protein
MIKVKKVPTVQMGAPFYFLFEMPESDTDPILEFRDNLETRRDTIVSPNRKSYGSLLEIWQV